MRGLGGAPFLEAIDVYNRRVRAEQAEASPKRAHAAIEGDAALQAIWQQASPTDGDAGHDGSHLLRVAEWALRLGGEQSPEAEVLASALLHDYVNVPKNSPERHRGSELSAEAARPILVDAGFDADAIGRIAAAIRDHSFSRGAVPQDVLGRALQDADRLDAVGAIGLMRAIATGVRMGGALMHPEDPWAENRPLDDKAYSLDHFFTKLLRLPDTMNTQAGRREAERRVAFMRSFLFELAREIDRPMPKQALAGGAAT
jgi:uncharacterized protein